MTFRQTDLGQLDYYEDGEGATPLVLLHGTGADGDLNFAHLMAQWGNRRVIQPNLPGADPNVDPGPVDLETVLDGLDGVIDGTAGAEPSHRRHLS